MITTVERVLRQVASGQTLGDQTGRPAYAYLRVSSEEQASEEASGLPRQLARIGEKARAEGLSVPEDMVLLDDGFSGYEYSRPAINVLVGEIESGNRRSDTIIVEDIDRLARDTDLQGHFFTILAKRHGIRILFWREPGSKLERLIRGYMSDEEMQRAKQRMTEGTMRKAMSGRITAKVPAYGYRFVDSNGEPSPNARKDTHYALDPEKAPIVRLIYDKVVYEGWSLYRLAQHLAELRIATPRGGRFWDTANLRALVRRPVYKGEYIARREHPIPTGRFNGEGRPIMRPTERPEEEWVRVEVPAIVTAEEWALAQEAMSRKRKVSLRNGGRSEWLLAGLARCARCRRAFAASSAARRDGGRVRYYMCRSMGAFKAKRDETYCGSPSVSASDLEEAVWMGIARILIDPELLLARLDERGEEAREALYQERIARIDKEMAECDRERERWDRAYGRSILELDEYEEKVRRVKARRAELERSRGLALSQLAQAGEIETKKEAVRERLAELTLEGVAQHLPFERKRRILELLVDEVLVDSVDGRVEIRGAIRAAARIGEEGDRNSFESSSAGRSTQKQSCELPFVLRAELAGDRSILIIN